VNAAADTPHVGTSGLVLPVAMVIVWAAITVGGSVLAAGPSTPLDSLMTRGLMLPVLVAGTLIAVVVQINGWWGQMGLSSPRPATSLALLWLPLVFIANFALAAASAPWPAIGVIALVAINTLMVGASEELAFRGMLWSQVRERLPFWSGFALVSALFGSVHVLNGFITGDWAGGAIQAFNAAITGALFLALRVRTGSLLVLIMLHALWDFVLFFASASDGPATPGPAVPPNAMVELTTIGIIAVPVGLYALLLVRNERARGDWRADPLPMPAADNHR
jgi:membrane protease YdiL (CAAX protease family)